MAAPQSTCVGGWPHIRGRAGHLGLQRAFRSNLQLLRRCFSLPSDGLTFEYLLLNGTLSSKGVGEKPSDLSVALTKQGVRCFICGGGSDAQAVTWLLLRTRLPSASPAHLALPVSEGSRVADSRMRALGTRPPSTY